jgi:hypothetical protein
VSVRGQLATSHYVQDDDPNLVVAEIVRMLDVVGATARPSG